MSVLQLLKLVPPGSIGLLVVFTALGLGLSIFVRFARRAARVALGVLFLVYVVLALPKVADGIAGSLPPTRQDGAVSGAPLDAVIVLDGDNRRGRVMSVRLLDAGAPMPTIVVLADADDRWVVNNLVSAGIPNSRITLETGANTTREQVDLAYRTIASHSWGHVALVVSRLQAPRLSALTRAWRPLPVIVSAPVDDEPARRGIWAIVPSYVALRVSRDALYEHFALIYYRWRGWI